MSDVSGDKQEVNGRFHIWWFAMRFTCRADHIHVEISAIFQGDPVWQHCGSPFGVFVFSFLDYGWVVSHVLG
jgi:hypothetical protein